MIRQLIKRNLLNSYMAIFVFLGLIGLSYVFLTKVNLTPQVESDFFFSEDSQIYKNDVRIYKKFLVGDSILLTIPNKDITTPAYLQFIERLSQRLKKVKGVNSVQSMTHGPEDIKAALQNPMWRRYIDTKSRKNSLIICWIDIDNVATIVPEIKSIIRQKEFSIRNVYISGIPYIIEEIRRMLSEDMKTFMVGAVAISSVVLLCIFLSFLVTLGAMVAALSAAVLTLTVQHFLGVPVGILTANLGAIVYVLTISHIVFLTSNWRQDRHEEKKLRLASTITTTLPASFWAMATTVFGFGSLIFVEAKPLQQLGMGGSLGTLAAFLGAYLVYPIFLYFSKSGKKKSEDKKSKFPLPLPLGFAVPLALIIVSGAGFLIYKGLPTLNTDPSLLTYFKESQDVYKGIRTVDRYGGSNPLNFVVSDKEGNKLKNEKNFQKMMDLQKDLESHPAVGSVLSLATLMAESQTNWLARLLPWGTVLNVLSRSEYDKVARGFVTEDKAQALYIIRMKETGRKLDRYKIVNHLMAKPRKHNLRLDLVGGSYYLQSELARKIRNSMKTGVAALVGLFAVIIFLISLSFITTFNAALTIAATTSLFLGTLGWFKIPVDIISSPAVNIILGLAVDGMIHMILAAKRASKDSRMDKASWKAGVKSQGPAIMISGFVIASGFSVFYLSSFPPSQRFGLGIVFGSIVAMLLTLLVFPHLCLLFKRK